MQDEYGIKPILTKFGHDDEELVSAVAGQFDKFCNSYMQEKGEIEQSIFTGVANLLGQDLIDSYKGKSLRKRMEEILEEIQGIKPNNEVPQSAQKNGEFLDEYEIIPILKANGIDDSKLAIALENRFELICIDYLKSSAEIEDSAYTKAAFYIGTILDQTDEDDQALTLKVNELFKSLRPKNNEE